MSSLGRIIDGVPRASAKLEEGIAFGVEECRLSGSVAVYREPLVPVARVPGQRVHRPFLIFNNKSLLANTPCWCGVSWL